MKIIKYKLSNWYEGFEFGYLGVAFNGNRYLKQNNINFVEDNDNPDIIIYGTFRDFITQSCIDSDSAIKLLYITEPISPDFIFFDYCLGFEPYEYGDRYCCYPFDIIAWNFDASKKSKDYCLNALYRKTLFCDFIYSHNGSDVSRKHYFDLLNSYKRVESAGVYLNNQPNQQSVSWSDGTNSKYSLQKQCKFSLCIQSTNYSYYINEKIVHCFMADEIPIFYGPKEVKEIFNPKRFIFVDDFKNDEELLKRIIEIDSNDDLYCQIISEPIFNNKNYKEKTIDKVCKFIFDIVDNMDKKTLLTHFKGKEMRDRIINMNRRKNKPIFRIFGKVMKLLR